MVTLAMKGPLDHWFATEILVHEAALMRYLRRVWSNAADVSELRQEIYVRVYEGAAKSRPGSPKSFLFTTARNLMVDRVRRERIVSIDYTQDLDALNVLVDEISPEQRLSARQELRRLGEAFDQLPDIVREVIWLRRVEGLSQREAAQRLGIQEGTLESHLCRGLRTLANAVFGNSPEHVARGGARESDKGTEHGKPGD
jgi:RNA polymerase sigma factor (sigma-70 family)